MSFTYLSVLPHASLRVIAIVREADGEKGAIAVVYFIHILTEMRGRCKEIDVGKNNNGFFQHHRHPGSDFHRSIHSLLFLSIIYLLVFSPYHLFIHSSRAEWQGQQQHLMQGPPTPGAISHYDRAFRDESLLRIKDRRMGGDAGL